MQNFLTIKDQGDEVIRITPHYKKQWMEISSS